VSCKAVSCSSSNPKRRKKAYLKAFWFSNRNVILIFFNTFNPAAKHTRQCAPF
jgi:hypothetical protein